MEWIAAGIFSLILGVVGVWTGIKQLRNRAELNNWRTTAGKVVERGTYKPNLPPSGPPAFHYSPFVRYVYQVDNKEFENNCIYPKRIQAPPRSTQKWAQKKADSFPEDVVVHYNAADPGDAYIVQTSRGLLMIVAAVSVFMILFGLIILLAQVSG
jgi:hypothetical protein